MISDLLQERHDDEEYDRFLAEERRDRQLDYAPADVCRDCGQRAVEVSPSEWQCGCDR